MQMIAAIHVITWMPICMIRLLSIQHHSFLQGVSRTAFSQNSAPVPGHPGTFLFYRICPILSIAPIKVLFDPFSFKKKDVCLPHPPHTSTAPHSKIPISPPVLAAAVRVSVELAGSVPLCWNSTSWRISPPGPVMVRAAEGWRVLPPHRREKLPPAPQD